MSAQPAPEPTARLAEVVDEQPERVLLHMPVDVRSLSQAVVAVMVCVFAMQWAKLVLVPILFGVMTSYSLTPIVNQLERLRVPRAAGAALLLTGIALAAGWGAWSLRDQASALVETLPEVTQKVRELAVGPAGADSTITKVQKAAAEIQAVADSAAPSAAASGSASTPARHEAPARTRAATAPAASPLAKAASGAAVTRVIVEKPALDVRGYVLSGTLGAAAILAQVGVVFLWRSSS